MFKTIKQCIKLNSERFYIGLIIAFITFVLSLFIYKNIKAGLFFLFSFIVVGMIKLPDDIVSPRVLKTIYIVWVLVTAVVVLFLSQLCMNEVFPENTMATVLSVVLILFLYIISFLIFLRIRGVTIIISSVIIVFSCANYYVYLFRGSEIIPADILSIATAGNVAAEYSFRIPVFMYYSLVLFVLYCFTSYVFPKMEVIKRGITRVISGIIAIISVSLVCIGSYSIKPLHWLQTGSTSNGFLFNFTIMLKDSFPRKPENYNVDLVNKIGELYSSEKYENEKNPDIIVIMDESFADLGQLGSNLNTNTEVTPFINSLTDNTLHGYTLSSVFGGGTPNSEYEFLTCNSLLFLPVGSIAYQQFINNPVYSVARELKMRGYSTVAMHQYLSSSWMRDRIWPLLGFDKCIFIEDFPQNDVLRGWGTDQEMFETLTSLYEDHIHITEDPIFVFGVTIQNHGGYDYSGEDFTAAVNLEGYSQTYPDADQYLTCIKKTDEAVKWLINYYESIDRDVVILFYGDHFPRLNDAFMEEVHGGAFISLDEQVLEYRVPFFIWTNYESESGYIDCISMNYLSNLLYKKAGIDLPPYNLYLEQLRQVIPFCNAYGFYSKSVDRFIPLNEAKEEEIKALLEYNYLVWNSIFDDENRNTNLFPTD